MTRRRVVRTAAGPVPVTIDSDGRAHVAGTALMVSAAGAGAWRVADDDGRARLVHVAQSPEGVWVHVDGAVFLLETGETGGAGARTRPAAGEDLTAPMPATVLSIVAGPGTQVAAGDTLLLLEAMKMELPIRAPRNGVVAAVHCREGEMVQPGVVLVDLT